MPQSELRLIRHCVEFCEKEEIGRIPPGTRGIYVLFKKKPRGKFDVVYVGMAGGKKAGIRSRLKSHFRSKKKFWTNFSAFEVWENIREEEVREIEGLFRYIYRKDSQANKLNLQRGFKKLVKIRRATAKEKWLNKDKQRRRKSTR